MTWLWIALGVVAYCGVGLALSIAGEESVSYRRIPLPLAFHAFVMLVWPVLVTAALIMWAVGLIWNRRAP